MSRAPTGPSGDQFDLFAAGPFTYLRELGAHGSIVGIDLAGTPTAVVYDLDAIHEVFADKLHHIGRAAVFSRLSHATGNGILTNYNWDTWQPRRQRIVKPIGARAVGRFHERMVAIIDDHLNAWPPGEHCDLATDVRGLTLRVVTDLLFSTDLTPQAEHIVDRAVQEIHSWAEADPANADYNTEPESFRAAIDSLDDYISDVINSRDPADPGDDMVGILLAASNEPSPVLDRVGVRDEAVTLILAGHETVTNTISFGLDLVARHPSATHSHADPRHIVDETLRLYPPVHVTNKAVVKDLNLGEVTVPAGWDILVPHYVIYRDPGYFDRPEEFLPQRWAPDSTLRLERRAYFPFLTGPKFCVGRHFAILEATETISRFLGRFQIEMLDPDPPWGREFALSFAPDKPMPYRLTPNP